MSFAALYRKRANLRSARVWQNRFWDHIIRDMDDRNRHLDYIHYNPVKHGHVSSPFEWEYSSIHDFRKQGFYASDWGVLPISVGGDYGE
jgi:putative transposase